MASTPRPASVDLPALLDQIGARIEVYTLSGADALCPLLYANGVYRDDLPIPPGGLLKEICPQWAMKLQDVHRSGLELTIREAKGPQGRVFDVRLFRFGEDAVAAELRDVTESVAEKAGTQRQFGFDSLLGQIASAAMQSKQTTRFIESCLPLIAGAFDLPGALYVANDSGVQVSKIRLGYGTLSNLPESIRKMIFSWNAMPCVAGALQTGKALVCPGSDGLASALGIKGAYAVLPIADADEYNGFMLFEVPPDPGRAGDFADQLNRLAAVLGQALDGIRMMQRTILSEAKFRNVFERSITGKAIVSLKGGILLDANRQFCDLTLYRRDEVRGKTMASLNLWADPQDEKRFVATIESQGLAEHFEVPMRRKDGTIHTVLIHATVITLEDEPCIMADMIDIDERKRAETALYESEQLLQTVVEGVDGGLAVRDKDGRYVYTNSTYALRMNHKPEELVGKTIFDVFPQARAAELLNNDRKLLQENRSETTQDIMELLDGSIRHDLVRKNPIYLGTGKEQNLCVFLLDITQQKQTEEALDESNARYRMLFDTMSNGFALHEIICDEYGKPVDYRFLDANPAFERMTGLSAKDIVGKTVLEVLPGTEPYWIESYGAVALRGEAMSFENYSAAIGKYFAVTAYSPQKGRFAVLAIDITERKEMEAEIFAEKEKLRVTLTSIGDGVITTDKEGRVEILNSVAEEYTGWKADEAKGKRLTDVFPIYNEVTGAKAVNPISRVIKSGMIVELANHTALVSKDGIIRSIADSAAPIKDEQGAILGAVLVFRDVTDEKRRNERIRYLSYHDPMTNLFNRNYLNDEFQRKNMDSLLPIGVVMGDVNGLKLTNDIFGHKEGDRLLRVIADIIRSQCRPADTVARWAGDEFLILMPGSDKKAAANVCRNINVACEEFNYLAAGLATPPSISLGIAVLEDPNEDILQAVKIAEDNMYKRKLLESRSAHSAIIASLKESLYEKSNETEEHAARLAEFCCKIGHQYDLAPNEIDDLHLFAILHDIGKIAVSDTILNKPSALSDEEWEEMKRHPEIGYRIAQCTSEFRSISEYILTHHERWDGTGYMQGLKGEEIPLPSRILAVVDAYDAMTNSRPYRDAIAQQEAEEELRRCAGTQFDPEVVSIFLDRVLPEHRREKSCESVQFNAQQDQMR